MRYELLVYVGQKDIDNGVSFSANLCPVAIAVKRKVPWPDCVAPSISVSTEKILIGEVVYHAPRSVANFVRYFDRYPHLYKHPTIVPFKFWLRREDELRT